MATEIAIRRPDEDRLKEIDAWLKENVGPGSFRSLKTTWLGMDDWFYYINTPDEDESDPDEDDVFDIDAEYEEPNLVYAFRREADATLFALRWTTAS
jgi:hypothetical protein